MTRPCRHCGALFTPAQAHHQFCTPRCRQASFERTSATVRVRLTRLEHEQVRVIAQQHGDSISGFLRDVLCEQFGVGDWPVPSSLRPPS